ncbi:GH25 family lysozyme, partial [Pedosphaera parvula]
MKLLKIFGGVIGTAFLMTSTLMAQRPHGIDVSSYQGTPNWTSVKNCGWTFAWAKATEGVSITDGSYRYNINNGKAAGVYMGA